MTDNATPRTATGRAHFHTFVDNQHHDNVDAAYECSDDVDRCDFCAQEAEDILAIEAEAAAPAAPGLDDLKPDGWHTYHVCGGLLREIVRVDGDQLMCTYCGEWYRAARLLASAPEDER